MYTYIISLIGRNIRRVALTCQVEAGDVGLGSEAHDDVGTEARDVVVEAVDLAVSRADVILVGHWRAHLEILNLHTPSLSTFGAKLFIHVRG